MPQAITPGSYMPEDMRLQLMHLMVGQSVAVSDGEWTYVVTKTGAARDVCESWSTGFDIRSDNPAFASQAPDTLPAAFTKVPRTPLPAPIDAVVRIGQPLHFRGIATGAVRSVMMV